MSPSYFRGPDIQKSGGNYQPKASVLTILEDALRRNGDHVAMIDGDSGERVSFSQLHQQSIRIAAGLQRAGVSAGDAVVLCCDKSILAYSLLLGAMFTGATAVLAPPPRADTIDKLTSGETVKAIFYDSAFTESVSQSLARMTPPPSLLGEVDSSDPVIAKFLGMAQEFRVFQVKDVMKHVPVVFFSSGTTGIPKGVEISDLGVQLSGAQTSSNVESLLVGSPLYWYSGLCTLVGSALNNYTMIFTNCKDAGRRLQLIEKYQVVWTFASVDGMIQYIDEPSLVDSLDLSSLKNVVTGGDVILPSVVRKFATKVLKRQANFIIIYGATEGGVMTTLLVRDVDSLQLGAVGKAMPGVEIKILDDDGHVVQIGVIGTIWAKTFATKGYRYRDELNHNFLDDEGFYNTGDAGFFDDKGNLYLRGRVCDLINFRGIRNSPAILEDFLMTHPAIQDVAVVGKPHPSDIQHPTAFVVLRPEFQGTVTDHDIAAFVYDHVEDSMRLRGGVNFRDSLPRFSNGKVTRVML